MLYISLDENDLKCLVRGGVLRVSREGTPSACICLRDIGFEQMENAITLAENGIDIYKDHEKEIK